MIDHLWRERRVIGGFSLGIGGGLRRAAFALIARLEGEAANSAVTTATAIAPDGETG